MAMTIDEMQEIAGDAVELAAEIYGALRADSEGGRRVTQAERRRLGAMAAQLAAQLLRDLVD